MLKHEMSEKQDQSTFAGVVLILIGLVVVLSSGMPAAAEGRRYTFALIADDTAGGLFKTVFGDSVSINKSGEVAFIAILNSGDFGIFRGGGGFPTNIIIDGRSTFLPLEGFPGTGRTVDDSGKVAFKLESAAGRSIFTSDGGSLTEIAGTCWLCFLGSPSINNVGAVAFRGEPQGRASGIYAGNGGALTTIADANGPFSSLTFFQDFAPSINGAGTVAFGAELRSGGKGIFTSNGAGSFITIADTTRAVFADLTPGFILPLASINNIGTVVFSATLKSGAQGIFTSNAAGSLTTIAATSGAFRDLQQFGLGAPVINDNGQVMFVGQPTTGSYGIFTGSNPNTDAVVRVGDALFGSTVSLIRVSQGALNNAGQIAFFATLATGVNVIVRADPVPCQVNVTRLGQCAGKDSNHVTLYATDPPHWGAEIYAFEPPHTICAYGCGTTSLAMGLIAATVGNLPTTNTNQDRVDEALVGITSTDPGHLDDYMTSVGASGDYTLPDDGVNFLQTTRDLSQQLQRRGALGLPGGLSKALTFVAPRQGSLSGRVPVTDPTQPAIAWLDSALCQGFPVIVRVQMKTPNPNPSPMCYLPVPIQTSGDGHFVLVTGKKGNDYTIADPAGLCPSGPELPRFTLLSAYGDFSVRGYVKDAPPDTASLNISVGNNAELLVVDSAGQRTGFDGTIGNPLYEIPLSLFWEDNTENDETGGAPTGTSRIVDIDQPADGTYTIVAAGLGLGTYTIVVRASSTDGSPQPASLIQGISGPGSLSSFQIQFLSSPGAVSQVVRVATFQSTLGDISNSLGLGLIDDQGVANSLSQKIRAAADAAARGQIEAKRNILNAFENEIQGQIGKHVKEIAAQVLLGDADSLLGQIP